MDDNSIENFSDSLNEIQHSSTSEYLDQTEKVSLLIRGKKILEKCSDKGSINKNLILRTIVIIDIILDNRVYQANMSILKTKKYT